MMLNNLAALSTLLLILCASGINAHKIATKKVDPALSTWLICLAASLMAFVTYLTASNRDIVAGVLNGADVVSTAIISIAIIFFSPIRFTFKPFEKFYLFALILITAFWLFTSDAFVSNLLIQILISVGYIPTAHHIIRQKANSESFAVWGLILSASVVSLYPTINAYLGNGNTLALVYSVRSVVMLSLMLILMAYFTSKNQLSSKQPS